MMVGDKGRWHWRAGLATGTVQDVRWTRRAQDPEVIRDGGLGGPVAVTGQEPGSGVARA